jgi:ankyrin repeat protein
MHACTRLGRTFLSVVCYQHVDALSAPHHPQHPAAPAAVAQLPQLPKRRTALMAASGAGRLDIVRLLLARGAAVNQGKSDDAVTAVFIAAQSGHLDIVNCLADHGADLNAPAADDGCVSC